MSVDDLLKKYTEYTDVRANSQNALANISTIDDRFWAQLPAGFNAGLLSQFAPRINSTAKWENITAEEFAQNCRRDEGALYIHYKSSQNSQLVEYDIELCMPQNTSQSPWKYQGLRQDFSEQLYLNMNFLGVITLPTI